MCSNRKNIVLIACYGILFLASCSSEGKSSGTHETVDKDTSSVQNKAVSMQIDSLFNQTAQIIAGRGDLTSLSSVDTITLNAYKNYSRELNELWEKSKERRTVVKNWAESELGALNSQGGTLFYPFSGADFVHVDLFFPNFDNIIMLALETKGTFPDLVKLHEEVKLTNYLSAVKNSLKDILLLSFFRTLAMEEDFKSTLDGNIALFLYFLNVTGHEVNFVEPVSISEDGALVVDTVITASYDQGYRYYFKRIGQDKIKTLVYFAMNVQNSEYPVTSNTILSGLNDRKNVLTYLKNEKVQATYIKSASYLLHRPSFSLIRDFILENSTYVLQDDSGIPIQFFPKDQWNITYYGTYTRPINLFKNKYQPNLKAAYSDSSNTLKTLPFGIGYQFRVGTSNMQLGIRK